MNRPQLFSKAGLTYNLVCSQSKPPERLSVPFDPVIKRLPVVTPPIPLRLQPGSCQEAEDMPVEMQLSRIIISEINDNQVIFLREVDGDRQFPILIGIFEATSIDRRVRNLPRPRPWTHDLLVSAIEKMGGSLDSVIIRDLREHTYYADLRIKLDGEIIEVDARPSDAIAVAVSCDPPLPIFVEEQVLQEALSAD